MLHLHLLLLASVPLSVQSGCTVGNVICYEDSDYAKPLLGTERGGIGLPGAPMSLEYCAQLCSDAGYALAGVEYSDQCYCGNKYNRAPVKKECRPEEVNCGCYMACTGNPDEICGGYYVISAYDVSCSGAPEPAPKVAPLLNNPCLTDEFAGKPFCNAALSIGERVDDAVKRMSLPEKIKALGQDTPPIPSLGLQKYNWWNEASAGMGSGRFTRTTHFAYPITTGMSFNRTLWRLTGSKIGREARAEMNVGNAYSTLWTPVINLAREPRWGRNVECPGEDPYLTGEFAEHFVKGIQQAPEDPNHLLASACCKHYVANEMEDTTDGNGEHNDRFHVDSKISMQDLVDSYMRPFQACVEKGNVSSLMCSYNAVNGVPSCANDWLLQNVARENWRFDGYIVSDCDAASDVFNSHHFTETAEESVQKVLHAGMDLDCGLFVPNNIQSALDKGLVTEADIDERLKMLFRVRMRLSHFDPVGPLNKIPESIICSEETIQVSFDGVRQSAVLLKNEGATLPLRIESVGTVAVIGPNAKNTQKDAGYYGPGTVCGDKHWTFADAVEVGGRVSIVSTPAIPSVTSEDQSGIAAAVEMAKAADTVILAVGTDLSWAMEGHDAKSISFTEAQRVLIESVANAAKKPVIVAVMTATPLDLSGVLANPKVGAVLHLGQPSYAVMGVSDILYGSLSPAGRMIQTVYPSSYQDQISIFDFSMRPGPSSFARPDCTKEPCPKGTNPGRTYRFYNGTPVVPFGFGLSYTTFSYQVQLRPDQALPLDAIVKLAADTKAKGWLFIPTGEVTAAEEAMSWKRRAHFIVDVTNTGNMDADDVVLGFLTPPGAGQNGLPLKMLFGFERVHVKAGETVSVSLSPSLTDFAQPTEDGRLNPLPGEYQVHFGIAETSAHGMGFVDAGRVETTIDTLVYM